MQRHELTKSTTFIDNFIYFFLIAFSHMLQNCFRPLWRSTNHLSYMLANRDSMMDYVKQWILQRPHSAWNGKIGIDS